jgi:PAS domain S-box-containing protein
MDLTKLDFDQARTKHLLFKTKLRSILYGAEVDQAPVLSEQECGLGKWIYGHALEKYGHIPEMHDLEKIHFKIHECARNLVGLYTAGEVDAARAGLPNMEIIADNVVALISVIELKIESEQQQGNKDRSSYEKLSINYNELLELHKTIRELDERIKEQATVSNAARKLAELNENKFRSTVMQAPVGIVILRGEDMIVDMANETYLSIVDRKRESFVGNSLYQSLPEVKETVSPILLNILRTGEPFYGNEFPVTLNRFGNKEQTYFNFVYHPLREEDESISGIIVVATEVTLQVKSRKALEQKEAQFRNMVSRSPVAMAIFRGPEFIIDLANDTLLNNIWRKTMQEVEGKKLLDVFPELFDQPFPQLLKEVYTTGKIYSEKEALAIVNSHDGEKSYYLDFEYSALKDIDDSVYGIMVTVNDVTEKVIARRNIEIAEKRYRDLIETLPVAVFTVDSQGYIDLYNQAAVQLWGRKPVKGEDKWHGSHALFTLDKTPMDPQDFPVARAMKENRGLTTELYIQSHDETVRHVIAHPQPIYDSDGNISGAMNVLIDITERKESENALRASEEKFRVLANSMPQFIWTANPQGELNYFSQSVYDYSGFNEVTIFELGWIDIVHPDDRAENVRLWIESITTGKPFHFEHRFRNYKGDYRWQLSRAVPQIGENGEIMMWVGTSTDIHDKRLFMGELQEQVEERTRALKLTNENLVRSNNELLQFTYVASHDLQEPLRKIQTFISRIFDLDSEALSAKGRDYFNRIQKSANRTQVLIQDLLAYSRANTFEKKFEPVDLNEVLAKTLEDLSELLQQKKVTINAALLPTLNGISFQLVQLFNNLITNAVKFSKENVLPVIQIDAELVPASSIINLSVEPGRNYFHIRFSDNGIGFESQFNERIFLVFQRLHERESYEGTGIGLAICKKIAENHNGFITGEGQPDIGAVFHVYLPE